MEQRTRGQEGCVAAPFNHIEDQKRHLQQFKDSILTHPYLCLSFGLYWMQTILLFQSPYLFLDPSPLSSLSPFPKGTILLVASVITYLIWALSYRRANRFSEARWFPFALASLLVLGALLYTGYPLLTPRHHDLAILMYLGGSVLIGCGTANICLETGRMFGYLGPLHVLFAGSAALFVGTLGALAITMLPALVGQIALVLIPLPMVACLWKCLRSVPSRALYGQGLQTPISIPVKFLVTSFFQGLALGVMHSALINAAENSALVVSVGFFVAVALLFFCAIAVKNNFDVLIYRIGFPLMALGFFTVGMFDFALLPGALTLDAGYCFQYLMTCSLCAYLAKGLKQPPIWIIGTGTAALLLGQFFGSVLDVLVDEWQALAIVVAFTLLLAALFMTSSQNIRRGWGAVSPGASPVANRETTALDTACQLLASEHGLTPRETDVFELMVRGYSRKAIADELSLAEETVKTHTGRIYQKFLVHSKQELINAAEQRAQALES